MCDSSKHIEERKPSLVRRIAVLPIKLYRLTLSAFLGRRCRFEPTCSAYAIEAIEIHGIWRGFWLGLSRVWRCSPWGDSGYDPVPEKLAKNGIWGWKYGRWGAKHKKQL